MLLGDKKIKIAINGFGRVGRAAFKVAIEKSDLFEVVAINDLSDAKTLAHLLKYDTVYGIYKHKVYAKETKAVEAEGCVGTIVVGDWAVPVFSQKDPLLLPWKKLQVDVVIESTGAFTTKEKSMAHIQAGAGFVVISAPANDKETSTYVLGVNTKDGIKEKIISNASCTTNCIAPVMKVLNEEFGIEKAFMTTAHSYTADQCLVDGPHKDLRRARAAAQNIIPTTTGAAISVTETIPDLKGLFDGIAMRVPTLAGSISDVTALVKKQTNIKEVNDAFIKASKSEELLGILYVTEDPIVSSDVIGSHYSAIVDLNFTNVVGGNLVKVLAWYDNEWGYANRLIEITREFRI